MHSLTCTNTHSWTHKVPGEGAWEAGLALRGGSFLYSSLVITGFGSTGSPGSSTFKELMAMRSPPTQRITLHCWQVLNYFPPEPLQAIGEKRVGIRCTCISQLLAVPWRNEWQSEKLHCSDFLQNSCSVNKVICSNMTPVVCALMFRQIHCYCAFEDKS